MEPSSGTPENTSVIFYGGDIITVNDLQPTAEALAVRNGKIRAVGDLERVKETMGPSHRLVDLAGGVETELIWL